MIDIGQKLRKSYFDALDGNLTWDGGAVPVVDEKLDVQITDQDVYIIMTAQNEVDANNKTYWARECDIELRIINRRKATNTKEVVENVSDQVLTLLYPTKNTTVLAIDSPLSLTYSRLTNAEYDPLAQTEDGFVISKKLVFKNRITQ